jgi:CubicO group peptidase (beta-lactamase class C family)/transcriptional regulator with XRE-family HTH domain
MASVPEPFGILLRRFRASADYTQEQLAERADLSTRAVSDLERGIIARPREYTVRQLAEALELSGDEAAEFEQSARASHGLSTARSTVPLGTLLGSLPAGALVGRGEEMDRMATILDALPHNNGHFLVLAGDRGVGKTRLLQELMVEGLSRGYAVITARCSEGDRGVPFRPILAACSGLASHASAGAKSPIYRLWKRVQAVSLAGSADNQGAHETAGHQELLSNLRDMLLLSAESRPLVMILDDLERADRGTLRVLPDLASSLRTGHVLLAGSFRDVGVTEDFPELANMLQMLSREQLAERIVIRSLSLEETSKLVAGLMNQTSVSEEFAGFVYRRTKGTPRLVEELVRSMGGRLELLGEIGAGSMGRVFRAFDRQTDTVVAAKLVMARVGVDLEDLLRFQQEASVLSALDHPNIVRIHDTFTEEHASCIIMELLEGRSLGRILDGGPLPLARAKKIALQVAEALSYAHSRRIVHRDVKPDNIMVSDDVVKVTDFGIARILPRDTMMGTVATTGMRIGTPLYMAPEQIEGKRIDPRTDVYGLGAMVFHIVAGRPPFDGDDALAIAVKQVQERPPPLSAVTPHIPADWDALVLKALAKDPNKRFQTASEMKMAISHLPEALDQPARGFRRRSAAIAAGAPVFALVAAVIAWLWLAGPASTVQASAGTRIDNYLSVLTGRNKFSGTVLVARRGKIILNRGYGLAFRGRGIKNGPKTRYILADATTLSMSEAQIAQSVANFQITWGTPICNFLPQCPVSWRSITFRELAAGKSRFPNRQFGIPGSTEEQSIASCQSMPLVRVSASVVRYSSCDGLVLGFLVATVNSVAWGPWLGLVPGVSDTGQMSDGPHLPKVAVDYNGNSPDANVTYSDYIAAWSTAPNLYAYDNAFFAGSLLAKSNMPLLLSPRTAVAPSDAPGFRARWGYGWKVGTIGGQTVYYTVGRTKDFQTVNMRLPRSDTTVIILSNNFQNDAVGIALHAATVLLGVPPPRAAPSHAAEPLAAVQGDYVRTERSGDRKAVQDLVAKGYTRGLPVGSASNGASPKLRLVIKYPDFILAALEHYTGTSGGRLILWGYPDNFKTQSLCENLTTQPTPSGYYRWSLAKGTLTIWRTNDAHCRDRAALVQGVWHRVQA